MTGRGPRDRDEEFARELQDHLALEAEDREAAGLSADQAKYAALRAFGNTAIVKEDVREVWTWTALHSFARNVRFAMRMLFKNPGFAAVAITTLALGIGANTAIFTVVNGLLIRPLPYNEPDALVVPSTIFKRSNSDRGSVSYADIRDWKSQTHLLTAVAAATPAQFDVTGGEGSERVAGLLVDHDYFRVITDRPLVGRTFTAEEDQPGANRVVMLSEAAWMRRFGGDPNVVGKSIEISGEMHRIVGVFPKTLDDKMEVLKPLALGSRLSADTLRRDNHVYWAVGRLAPGVTLEKARSQFTAMGARIAQEHSNRAQTGLKLHRLRDYIVGPTLGRILWVLLAAVLLLLIIACVNVANLLLARSAARQREVGIRVALGAGWRALAAQFAAESLVLTVLGAVLGVLVGIAGHKALIRYAPEGVPALSNVAVDANVLAFTLLVSAGTAVLFGMAPLIQALGKAPGVSVRQSGRSSTAGAGERRLRAVLVISELALAVILLSAAGLLVRSFQRLQSVEPGFATENRLTLNLGLPRSRYAAGEPTVQAFRQILDKVERLPGVVSAAATSSLPVGGGGFYLGRVFLKDGQPEPPASKDTTGQWSVIQPGLLKTLGIPLVAGRDITEADTANSTPVILISQSMAKQLFGDANPIGRRIRSWRDENLYREIIGVVGDVRYFGLGEQTVNNVYVPHAQNPWPFQILVLHTQGAPGQLIADVRSTIAGYDRRLAVSDVKTIEQIVTQGLARQRFAMFLLSAFAATALLMSAIGIYGLLSYAVAQDTREIGIRMALGALRGDILRRVTRRALALAAIGVLLGLGGSVAVTHWMKALLFGVSPTDEVTLAVAALMLVTVALIAAYIPARRASNVDPLIALRYE